MGLDGMVMSAETHRNRLYFDLASAHEGRVGSCALGVGVLVLVGGVVRCAVLVGDGCMQKRRRVEEREGLD